MTTEANLTSPKQVANWVSARQISKSFKSRPVIQAFSHEFGCGLHAVMGPNGVGKSTLLGLLAGALDPDEGEIHVCGRALRGPGLDARQCLSYMPSRGQLYPFMTGSDLLQLVMAVRALPSDSADELVEGFGLRSFAATPVLQLSEGTLRKFCVVSTLLGNARVLLLDEPTSGLDAVSIDFLRGELLKRHADSCIIFATHDEPFCKALAANTVRLALRSHT